MVSFTVPYAATPASFIAVKARCAAAGDRNQPPSSLTMMKRDSDCAGKSSPERKNDRYRFRHRLYPFIDKYFKDVADIREYSNSADAIFGSQARRRIDAVFDDITFANTTLARPESSNLSFQRPAAGHYLGRGGESDGRSSRLMSI